MYKYGKHTKTKNGFTLIELLVVISIIGLLSAIVLVALNTARQKARDATRESEAKQFQTALEVYYSKHGNYPLGNSGGSVQQFWSSSGPGKTLITDGDIGAVPADPIYGNSSCNSSDQGYCYCSKGGDSYVLTVHLEKLGGTEACYFDVGPNASTFCNGHQHPASWAPVECSTVFH